MRLVALTLGMYLITRVLGKIKECYCGYQHTIISIIDFKLKR